MLDATAAQKDRLMHDLRVLMTDAETLLQTGAGEIGHNTSEARERMVSRMHQLRQTMQRWQDQSASQVRAARDATNHFVHDNPWKAAGLAAGAGLLLGLLITRR